MNIIFTAVTLISTLAMLVISPEGFLPALLSGSRSALETAATLFCIYAVWMGLSAVAEDAKLTDGLSRLMSPACKKIFKTNNLNAVKYAAMNLSCNLIGIGGAATPYGVKAIDEFEKDGNLRAQDLLFIINATSIQLIPTTVIALRAAAGSKLASDIALPSLLSTALSTLIAISLYLLSGRKSKCST